MIHQHIKLSYAHTDMTKQICACKIDNGVGYYNDSGISACEMALATLEEVGLAKYVEGKGHKLLWDKMQNRIEVKK